ncbi:CheR family methyltransferase [Thiohalobacter sp. IOR34]|uniref:CheR family methyltransferase n=1 Tax=Thiohalobacter sp. IOR34 TaxID=3057176 RepID=UPI0025B06092|nr:CheR family methyltransferase [Thiohalobacter sp. IOR34]WJW74746.1 CheR family methyltransferase [Thiohalobacter sp. IOR34]
MSLEQIAQLLQQRMGLDASTVGLGVVEHAVLQRMTRQRLDTTEAYLLQLQQDAEELQQLIEEVVVPETWFFRDLHPFQALAQSLENELQRRPLRLLSLPCSTGEEAYTLAMTLLDAGLEDGDFHIDGIDISQRNLAAARTARYRPNAFRGDQLGFRERYFNAIGGIYELDPRVRRTVHFECANLLETDLGTGRDPYDVIFCRNLLIYFDRPTRERALDVLDSLLHDDGLLFLGHAEANALQGRPFQPLPQPRCFGFRRLADRPSPREPQPVARPLDWTPSSRLRRPRPAAPALATAAALSQPEPPAETAPSLEQRLAEIEGMADQGALEDAAAACEALLQTEGPVARAFYLLGLIRHASNHIEAADALLRKALYLDPDYCPAISQLALLCERQGKAAEAGRLRQRLARCLERHPEPSS